MRNIRLWKVWVDKDGQINSHPPYIPTSPVEWIEVSESRACVDLHEALKIVVEQWTSQFERNGHLAPSWVKQARSALSRADGLSENTNTPAIDNGA